MKKFKIVDEFKEFAIKGNVIDMAVGVIIGGAFGKIVTSLVNDIITPAISPLTGRMKVEDLALTIGVSEGGDPLQIKYGAFLQNVMDFLIVAMCIFLLIKVMSVLKQKQEQLAKDNAKTEEKTEDEIVDTPEEKPEEALEPSKEELLLTEIRDILKERH